eukprot:7642096-Lingulodinium_polyedra.AAC.1
MPALRGGRYTEARMSSSSTRTVQRSWPQTRWTCATKSCFTKMPVKSLPFSPMLPFAPESPRYSPRKS